jgi:hypothetical protein
MDMLNGLQDLIGRGMVPRLAIDLTCMLILIRGVYFRTYRRSDLFLTFFSFNLVIFLIAWVLNSVEMTLGAAFGLFAVFSMLRYRTEGISTVDMTYLFLGIALGLIMAVGDAGPLHLAGIGGVLLGFTWLLEGGVLTRRELRQDVHYDRVELVHTGRHAELLRDLQERTGLPVHRVDVESIDLLRDAARLNIYYYAAVKPGRRRAAAPHGVPGGNGALAPHGDG